VLAHNACVQPVRLETKATLVCTCALCGHRLLAEKALMQPHLCQTCGLAANYVLHAGMHRYVNLVNVSNDSSHVPVQDPCHQQSLFCCPHDVI
jgi:hypothetical protein